MAEPKEETVEPTGPPSPPAREKSTAQKEDPPEKKTTRSREPVKIQTGPDKQRVLTIAVAVIAVVALGLAIWALMRPPAGSSASPTGEQAGEAKGRICADFNTVRTAVSLQTHADLGTEPVAVQAVAANARLAMAAGGSYMLDRLDEATPAELADAVRTFAKGLEDIAINALAGVSNEDPAQAARLRDTQEASTKVADLCK